MVRIKRVYDPPAAEDGRRILVDRLWPRGMKKESARIDLWLKDIAPSDELRQWFGHAPARWDEFRERYRAEIESRMDTWQQLKDATAVESVTLVYAARDTQRNNAVALLEWLEQGCAPAAWRHEGRLPSGESDCLCGQDAFPA